METEESRTTVRLKAENITRGDGIRAWGTDLTGYDGHWILGKSGSRSRGHLKMYGN